MEALLALMGGGIGAIFALVWGVLLFISPFFWYGTNNRTKETSLKLDRLIRLKEQEMERELAWREGTESLEHSDAK